jgi:hypothetical protein
MTLRRSKNLVIAYKNTFESPEGKLVLADLRKRSPLLTGGLNTAGPIDVNRLLVLEGQNNVLKYIYQMLKRDPNEERQSHAITREEKDVLL